MKVLHIMSGYGGGISSFIRNLAKEIDENRFSFDVMSFTDYDNEFNDEISRINGKTFTLPRPKKEGFYVFIRELISILKKNGPYDVIESHLTGYYALVFKLACMLTGNKRFVLHAHATNDDLSDSLPNRLKRQFNQSLSRLIATQLTSCSLMSSKFMFGEKALSSMEIIHIPNSISVENYMQNYSDLEKIELKEKNGIPTNKMVIGNIARFNLQKNHSFMVNLIKHLSESKLEFIWVFIGGGELEDEIKLKIKQHSLEKHVMFLGRREDANELYELLDVMVLPSFYEGLPTVIVEAQAAGINSVISNTITEEVDLKLGMVKYVSLDEKLEVWERYIIEATLNPIPNSNERIEKIKENGFSNDVAARLYEKFIEKKLSSYVIGEKLI